jgi:hypothetical protein
VASLKLSNPLKSALSTSLWVFIAQVALLAVGWLQQLAKWSSTSGHAPLPGLSTVGYALVGALVAASSGVIAFVVRLAQEKNVIPGSAPVFAGTPAPPPTFVPLGTAPPAPLSETETLIASVTKLLADADRVRQAVVGVHASSPVNFGLTASNTPIGGVVEATTVPAVSSPAP